MDPKLASYGVENPIYAVIQLAQTTMRSELGKITLDKTFEERDTLNEKIVVSCTGTTEYQGKFHLCSLYPFNQHNIYSYASVAGYIFFDFNSLYANNWFS